MLANGMMTLVVAREMGQCETYRICHTLFALLCVIGIMYEFIIHLLNVSAMVLLTRAFLKIYNTMYAYD